MTTPVYRLTRANRQEVVTLLRDDVEVNLFLLGFIDAHPLDRAWWYGVGRPLRGLVMVIPGRLAVPWIPNLADAAAIGRGLARMQHPCMMVGPRATVDAIWSEWKGQTPVKSWFEQRLYVLRTPPRGADPAAFRLARWRDLAEVSANSAAMELEDLGVDRLKIDAKAHENAVRERLKAGRVWVTIENGEVVFQINVGTRTRLGCQVGGTYTPVEHRGVGHASEGVAALCRVLLRRYPMVTLHVNEANLPAVRVYEKCGFVRAAPYRLLTL